MWCCIMLCFCELRLLLGGPEGEFCSCDLLLLTQSRDSPFFEKASTGRRGGRTTTDDTSSSTPFWQQTTSPESIPCIEMSCSVLVPLLKRFVKPYILPRGRVWRSNFSVGVHKPEQSCTLPQNWWRMHHDENHRRPLTWKSTTVTASTLPLSSPTPLPRLHTLFIGRVVGWNQFES